MDLDLREFLQDKTVPNLDWLDVDEVQYHKLDRLPKQNLDVIPDLEAQWSHEDHPSTHYLVPNTGAISEGQMARTMGDLSDPHGNVGEGLAEDIVRACNSILETTTDIRWIRSELIKRFGLSVLKEHRDTLFEVMKERGLLGNVYVASSNYPKCHLGQVSRAKAPFVISKTACGNCTHNMMVQGSDYCGAFNKTLVTEVPYSEGLAQQIEARQTKLGHMVDNKDQSPKERIRTAFLAPKMARSTTYGGEGVGKVEVFRVADNRSKLVPIERLNHRKVANTINSVQRSIQHNRTSTALQGLDKNTVKEAAQQLRQTLKVLEGK